MTDFVVSGEWLDANEERIWTGGAGTMFCQGPSTMQVRPVESTDEPDGTTFQNSDVSVGADGGVETFSLAKSFLIRFTAKTFVSLVGDSRFRGQ